MTKQFIISEGVIPAYRDVISDAIEQSRFPEGITVYGGFELQQKLKRGEKLNNPFTTFDIKNGDDLEIPAIRAGSYGYFLYGQEVDQLVTRINDLPCCRNKNKSV